MRITCESDSCWQSGASRTGHRVCTRPTPAGRALQRVRRHAYPVKDYTTRLVLQAVFGEGLHC